MLLLILALLSFASVGCVSNPVKDFFTRHKTPLTHVPQDGVVELREPAALRVWAHDKNGKLVAGYVNAYAGWLVGPAAPSKESEVK